MACEKTLTNKQFFLQLHAIWQYMHCVTDESCKLTFINLQLSSREKIRILCNIMHLLETNFLITRTIRNQIKLYCNLMIGFCRFCAVFYACAKNKLIHSANPLFVDLWRNLSRNV